MGLTETGGAMSDAEFDRLIDQLDAAIARAGGRVRFWTCPIKGHSDASAKPGWHGPTVEWVDDVATCLFPGCFRKSTDPVPRGSCECEEYECAGECCGRGGCSCSPGHLAYEERPL